MSELLYFVYRKEIGLSAPVTIEAARKRIEFDYMTRPLVIKVATNHSD